MHDSTIIWTKLQRLITVTVVIRWLLIVLVLLIIASLFIVPRFEVIWNEKDVDLSSLQIRFVTVSRWLGGTWKPTQQIPGVVILLPVLLFMMLANFSLRRLAKNRMRRPAVRQCLKCSYDLRSQLESGVEACPECGCGIDLLLYAPTKKQ